MTIIEHTKSNTLLDSLITMDPSFFSHVLRFLNAFQLDHSAYLLWTLLHMTHIHLSCVYLGLLVYAQVGL